MPESKKRKKVIERERAQAQTTAKRTVKPANLRSPKWWAPLMVTLMLLGLVVIVIAYVTAQSGFQLPIPGAGNWNLLVGMALMITGFLMTMGWK